MTLVVGMPRNDHLARYAGGLDREPLTLHDSAPSIHDFGWIVCPCPEGSSRRLCRHILNYVSGEQDKQFLHAIAACFERPNFDEQRKLIDVWVPFMPTASYVLADTQVALRYESDGLFSASLALHVQNRDFQLASLGLIQANNFSRRRLARRAAEVLMILALDECATCAYAPEPKVPAKESLEIRRSLLYRGAVMASSMFCDICRDMTLEVNLAATKRSFRS